MPVRERTRHVILASVAALAFCLGSETLHATGQSALKGDKELGRYLASECVTCHQITGRVIGHIPMILAWPEDQFIAVMQSYKERHRDNQVMQTIAGKLSDEEIAALAAFFGAQPLQPKIN